jgi:hypothetical protein
LPHFTNGRRRDGATRVRRYLAAVAATATALAFGLAAAPSVTAAATGLHRLGVVRSSPDVGLATNQLNGISCPGAGRCVAVGYADTKAGTPLVIGHSGTTWKLSYLRSPALRSTTVLNAVSCVARFCMAVGSYVVPSTLAVHALAKRWSGTKWKAAPPISPSDETILNGVSCSSSTFCVAVGMDFIAGTTVVETWDSGTWMVQPSYSPTGESSSLNGVSCVSRSFCMATGYVEDPTTQLETALVERWNGTSAVQVTPSTPGVPNAGSSLSGVSCPQIKFCVAVGQYLDPASGATWTLVERWNGYFWYEVPSGDLGQQWGGSFLLGVSCPSVTWCLEVGAYEAYGLPRPFALVWNGTDSFSSEVVGMPKGSVGGQLQAVSCVRQDRCFVDGWEASAAGISRNLIDSSR